MRKVLALGTAAASLAGMVAAASPASAADTNVTFTLTGNGLSLTVPTNPDVPLNTGTLNIGSTSVSAPLNATTVTDQRGQLLGSWAVQVSSTDFTNDDTTIDVDPATPGNQPYAIGKANGAMYLGADLDTLVSAATGGMVPTSAATAVAPATFGGSPVQMLAGTTAGTGSLTYTPTLRVTIPSSAVAGTYSATVTQTAS